MMGSPYPTIIVDLDNCISDDQWRMDRIRPEIDDVDERYRLYHDLMEFDNPLIPACLLRGMQRVVVFTSRPHTYRRRTQRWLKMHGLSVSAIYMRDETHMPCVDLKARFLARELSRGADIIRAYDDRQDIVDMYNAAGINGVRRAINER